MSQAGFKFDDWQISKGNKLYRGNCMIENRGEKGGDNYILWAWHVAGDIKCYARLLTIGTLQECRRKADAYQRKN